MHWASSFYDVGNGRGYTCVRTGEYRKSLYISLSFAMKLKLLEFLFKGGIEAKGNDSFISSSQLRDI